jgi:hypothetical protein
LITELVSTPATHCRAACSLFDPKLAFLTLLELHGCC